MNNKKTLSLQIGPRGHVIAVSDGTSTTAFTNKWDAMVSFAKLMSKQAGHVTGKNTDSVFKSILNLDIPNEPSEPSNGPVGIERYERLAGNIACANAIMITVDEVQETGIPVFSMDTMHKGYGAIYTGIGIMQGLSSKREARESAQKLCDECRFDKQHLKGLLEQIEKTPEEVLPEDSVTSFFSRIIAEKLAKGDYVIVSLDGPTGNDPF